MDQVIVWESQAALQFSIEPGTAPGCLTILPTNRRGHCSDIRLQVPMSELSDPLKIQIGRAIMAARGEAKPKRRRCRRADCS